MTVGQVADRGEFDGVYYEVINQHTAGAIVKIYIQAECSVKGIPGCMVATSGNIEIKGTIKKTLKAVLGPDSAKYQTFTAKGGTGWVMITPGFYGSIEVIQLDGNEVLIGDDAYVACTSGVETTSKAQGLKKAMFSGDGLFIKKATGRGLLFVAAVGSMIGLDVGPGESVVVDNEHLVLWPSSMGYNIAKASKGLFSTALSGEGAVARMTGPGRVYVQSRNPQDVAGWVYETQAPPN